MNITCPKCRFRHPADVSCAEAKDRADKARVKRIAQEQVDRTRDDTPRCLRCGAGSEWIEI